MKSVNRKSPVLRRARLGAAIAALVFATSASAGTTPGNTFPIALEAPHALTHPDSVDAPGLPEAAYYIVVLKDPALATYRGGVPGIPAPARNSVRLDVDSSAATAYVAHLASRQQAFLQSVAASGAAVQALDSFQHAVNAIVVQGDAETMNRIARRADVLFVEPARDLPVDTDAGPAFIGAPAIWEGLPGTHGEGVVVGIIDTGVNFLSPSFAATDVLGYTHDNPLPGYLGQCAPGGLDAGSCNDKLIGAYDFVYAVCTQPTNPCGAPGAWMDEPSATDSNGHGSHTAGTAAGNFADAPVLGGTAFARVSGVAPRANLITYDVCYTRVSDGAGLCPQAASVAAINQAVADGVVDVLNFSIGGGASPWGDSVSMAFLGAHDAGIVVAASAGNTSGSAAPGSTGHREPWTITVGASTHDRAGFGNPFSVAGPGTPPAEVQDIAAHPGTGPALVADMVDVPLAFHAANPEGCTAGGGVAADYSGSLVLLRRGSCNFSEKVVNATAAGAAGVLIANNAPGATIAMGALEATTVPSAMVTQAQGAALEAFITANAGTTADWLVNPVLPIPGQGDVMGGFSNRGPTTIDLLKPDVTAPGVSILAAFAGAADSYEFLQGTSMSSPHTAGSAALLRALNPSWSPTEIKSALMLSSNHAGITRPDAVTPSDPFDRGAGRVNLANASTIGLVMHETGANFLAADPATGGDPSALNLPSYQSTQCIGTCSFTRTVRNVSGSSTTYEVSVEGPVGLVATITPSSFTIAPGATQDITVELDTTGLPSGAWAFARLQLADTAATSEALAESFDGATFPPTGWTRIRLAGTGAKQWERTATAGEFDSTPAGARRVWSSNAEGAQDDWLVSPQVAVMSDPAVRFRQRVQFPADYDKHSVWASSGSCDPADGEFVEVAEAGVNADGTVFASREYALDGFENQSVCVAFRYEGQFASTWYVDGVSIVSSTRAPLHMPIAVFAIQPSPIIGVAPSSVAASADEGGAVVSQALTISNSGGVPLNWDSASTLGFAGAPVYSHLRTSAGNPGSGFSNGFYSGNAPNGVFMADSFTLTEDVVIGRLYADGFTFGEPSLVHQNVSFFVYPDAAGVPAGNPQTSPEAAAWSYTAALGSSGLSIEAGAFGGSLELDLLQAGQVLELPAGKYWLVMAPLVGTAGTPNTDEWFWLGSGAAENRDDVGLVIDPGNVLGASLTNWTALEPLLSAPNNVRFRGLSFEVNEGGVCGAPWLALAPASGTVAGGGSQVAQVQMNPVTAGVGVHEATLCIASNDAATPLVTVPVTFTVNTVEVPVIAVAPGALSATLDAGDGTSLDLDISNSGTASLAWEIDTAEQDGSGGYAYRGATPFSAPVGSARGMDGHAAGAAPAQVVPGIDGGAVASLVENFDDIALLPGAGWHLQNNSSPVGTTGWFQGNPVVFAAHAGASNSYIGANFNNTTGNNTISNWMLTPEVVLEDGAVLTFWARAADNFADRLQVRLSTAGASTNVGTGATAVGDFTTLLLDINPTYQLGVFLNQWVQYSVTLSGISAPTTGRFAFRYFVESGGPSGANSSFIGIDSVSITPAPTGCDAPSTIPWLSVTPDAGSTAPGTTSTVAVGIDASTLGPGSYSAQLCVNSNDPVTPRVQVPVTVTVEDAPDAQTIDFGPLADRTLGESPFTVSATATSGLVVGFASSTPAVCTVDGDEVSLLAPGTCTIVASQAGNEDWLPADDVSQSFEVLEVLITIAPGTLPRAQLGQAYSVQLSASGDGSSAPFTFAVTDGVLPEGMTLSGDGLLSGTPSEGGVFTYTVTATDSSGGTGPYSGSIAYTLEVVLDGIFRDGFEED